MAGTAHWAGEESVAFSTLGGLRFAPDQTRDDLSDTQLDAVEATAGMTVTRPAAGPEPTPEPMPDPAPEPAPMEPAPDPTPEQPAGETPGAETIEEPPNAAQE